MDHEIGRVMVSLFVTGLVLGCGPCLLTCGPLLVSYVTASGQTPRQAGWTYVLFSLTRLFVYGLLGILAGIFGDIVVHRFFESAALKIFSILFGIFLVAVGVSFVLPRLPAGHSCAGLVQKYRGRVRWIDVVVFALIVSCSPCLPLFGVIGYIALLSDHWFKGFLLMSSFALGTVISPLILLTVAASWVVKALSRHQKLFFWLRICACFILVYLGVMLLAAGTAGDGA